MKKKNIAEDTWFEIFLHLPMNSINKFKIVSKVWFSILSSPNFLHKWYQLNKSSLPWLFIRPFTIIDHSQHKVEMFTIAYQNGFSFNFPIPNFTNSQVWKDSRFFGSSNGLVLCRSKLFNNQNAYCVCNPLTQKWVSLPPPPPPENFLVSAFTCDDECFSSSSSLVPTSFKVVSIPRFAAAAKEFKVQMFSSELSEWNIYNVSFPEDVTYRLSTYDNVMTHNGVLYWFQKITGKILAVCVSGNTNHGTRGYEGRLINLPEQAMGGYDELRLRHHLGESEGLLCYTILKEKCLSVWVLEGDWCLLYKDNNFPDMLAEMGTLLIGGVSTHDLITQIQILGFSPVDKNVVILSYKNYIWSYDTKTKGYEQLCHPSFSHGNATYLSGSLCAFALKPRLTLLPPISSRDTLI